MESPHNTPGLEVLKISARREELHHNVSPETTKQTKRQTKKQAQLTLDIEELYRHITTCGISPEHPIIAKALRTVDIDDLRDIIRHAPTHDQQKVGWQLRFLRRKAVYAEDYQTHYGTLAAEIHLFDRSYVKSNILLDSSSKTVYMGFSCSEGLGIGRSQIGICILDPWTLETTTRNIRVPVGDGGRNSVKFLFGQTETIELDQVEPLFTEIMKIDDDCQVVLVGHDVEIDETIASMKSFGIDIEDQTKYPSFGGFLDTQTLSSAPILACSKPTFFNQPGFPGFAVPIRNLLGPLRGSRESSSFSAANADGTLR